MRIFVAGASGVIGQPLVKRLVENGCQVTGLTRTAAGAGVLRALGATGVVGDVFDRQFLTESLADARPEVVVNQLTAIPARLNPRRIDSDMAPTNRLRREGTQALVNAARLAGARRIISQSIAFAYRPDGDAPAKETDPLYTDAPSAFRSLISAVACGEDITMTTPGIEGVVLRYGYFYGPGTVYAMDGTFAADVRRRRVPIVGRGSGVFSFIHVDDAACATVHAVEAGKTGIYNIVDNEPAMIGEWLPHYAKLLGAPRPMRIPALLGRLGAGAYGMYLLTRARGASNTAARTHLGWNPHFGSWREGFQDMVEFRR